MWNSNRRFVRPIDISAPRGQSLSDDQLRSVVPSIFALEPWQKMSEKYRFVPTIQVLDKLRSEGFYAVRATQGRTRIEGKRDFTRHMLRLRHKDFDLRYVGQEIPEFVLLNSHDGTSAYQLYAGIFRVACLNGMIVESGDIGKVRARHSGHADLPSQVIDASFEVIERVPQVMQQVEEFKQLRLPPPQQRAFANAASELRSSSLEVAPDQLLAPRRTADRPQFSDGSRNLWETANVVQENILRGGVTAFNANNQRRHTRAVTAVADDVKINRGIWRLAEEMKKLAA